MGERCVDYRCPGCQCPGKKVGTETRTGLESPSESKRNLPRPTV